MNRKRLFKFYFSAEKLEEMLNGVALKLALSPAELDAENCARKIISVIEYKMKLAKFWNYMDDAMKKLSKEEAEALRYYGLLRTGLAKEEEKTRKLIRKAAVKFQRAARRTERFSDALRLIDNYYCIF